MLFIIHMRLKNASKFIKIIRNHNILIQKYWKILSDMDGCDQLCYNYTKGVILCVIYLCLQRNWE